MSNNMNHGQFGDTTLTKVFVGGLAWETPIEALKDHFDQFGQILEAVIISDKLTGRSKGYGFVTFKDAEAAKKACEEASPIINGRRANCNIASLGARRPIKSTSNIPPHPPPPPQYQQGISNNVGLPLRSMSPAPASHVQWYYPSSGTPVSPFHQYQNHQPVPFYGYHPAYIAPDHYSYNHQKLGYNNGGAYMRGNYSQVYGTGQAIMGANNTLMPMYQPLYHYHHQSHTMGLPSQMFPVATTVPTIISKPPSIAPINTGTMDKGESFKMVG